MRFNVKLSIPNRVCTIKMKTLFILFVHVVSVSSGISTEIPTTQIRQENTEPSVLNVAEFKETLEDWKKATEKFTDTTNKLKHSALMILTKKKDRKELGEELESMFQHGCRLYGTMLEKAQYLSFRLFESTMGFGESGRCQTMYNLSQRLNGETEPLAEVKIVEALVSDLDCLAGELLETVKTIHSTCTHGEHFGVDDALGMITETWTALYRFKYDGKRFSTGSKMIGDSFNSTTNDFDGQYVTHTEVKQLLRAIITYIS